MATQKFFRCYRPSCQAKEQGRFWSENLWPKCPQCQLDSKDPKFGSKIQRLAIIHYDPPTDFPAIGQNVRACEKERVIQAEDAPNGIPNPYHGGTAVPGQVNCEACKRTPEYLAALQMIEDEESPSRMAAALGRHDSVVTKS